MVTLPPEYIATKLPGYFWNTEDKQLYSMKIDGILKPLKRVYPSRFNYFKLDGYRVSYNGSRRWLQISDLNMLEVENSVIPVKE